MNRIEKGLGWELRLGDYREALANVDSVDSLICDPPYSERTHKGNKDLDKLNRRAIKYPYWKRADVYELVLSWTERTNKWICVMCDHTQTHDYSCAFLESKRYSFAPVPIIQPRVRLCGDGPASCTVNLMVARPKDERFMRWGSLPGFYRTVIERNAHIGGKPLALMRAIIRDYTRRGDIVCDPCAGYGTTLLAALIEGREAIGAEIDPETFDVAVKRLREGFTPDLFKGEY